MGPTHLARMWVGAAALKSARSSLRTTSRGCYDTYPIGLPTSSPQGTSLELARGGRGVFRLGDFTHFFTEIRVFTDVCGRS